MLSHVQGTTLTKANHVDKKIRLRAVEENIEKQRPQDTNGPNIGMFQELECRREWERTEKEWNRPDERRESTRESRLMQLL